jgi:teichuronic acid exporter
MTSAHNGGGGSDRQPELRSPQAVVVPQWCHLAASVNVVEESIVTSATPPSSKATDLHRSLVHGIAWTSMVTWFGQLLSWGATFYVARQLDKADYGLVATALLYLTIVQMFSEFGVGSAVVRFQTLTKDQIAQFNGLSMLLGVAGMAVSMALAKAVAWYFEQPKLTILIVVMSFGFIVTSMRVVPQALMQRDMQFRKLAILDGTQSICTATANVTMAATGFGAWTLALGPLIGQVVYMLLVNRQRAVPFKLPDIESIRQPFEFSRQTIATRFVWWGYSNADFIVVRKVLGEVAAGAYTFGWNIAGIAVEKITSLIGRVTPAFFATVQHDLPALRKYLLGLTEVLSVLTFPACVGLALVGADFVPVALGDEWLAATTPLRLLALVACTRSIEPLMQQVASAIGEPRINLNNSILTILILPIGVYAGARLGDWHGGAGPDAVANLAAGISGVAIAWVAISPLLSARLIGIVLRKIDLPARQYWADLWPAISGCLIMSAAVFLLDIVLPASTPLLVSLVAKSGAGALAYVATLLLMHRERIMVAREMMQALRSKQLPAKA